MALSLQDAVGSHRAMAHTFSMLKTNAVTRWSNKSTVGSPKGQHSRAVKSPTMQKEFHGRAQGSLCQCHGCPCRLHGDCTAFFEMSLWVQHACPSAQCENRESAVHAL